jgi:hypothetical protein
MHEANPEEPSPGADAVAPPLPGGVRAGPAVAATLYGLLLFAAALALGAQRFPGALPSPVERAAPWAFLAFAGCFATYRLALVQAKKYAASKAFFQIGVALFFFILLLWPRTHVAMPPTDALPALLQDADPGVRSLAAEVARYRPDGNRYAPLLVRALEDPDEGVRQQAHATLVRWAGVDLGGPGDPTALEAWKRRFP